MDGTLTIFDVDHTLFRSSAKTHVKMNEEILYSLSDHELADHRLDDGHSYDYRDFASAQLFYDTADPIEHMVEMARTVVKAKNNPNSKAIIITARPWLDDMKLFIKKFHEHGIDIDEVDVHCVGDVIEFDDTTAGEAKANIVKHYIRESAFNGCLFEKIRIYEDNIYNIQEFLNLRYVFPCLKFEAYQVDKTGSVWRWI